MIKALRVDERLIHGQIAMSWSKELKLTGLVVANNEAATNDVQKMTLKMAAPSGVKAIVDTISGAIKLLSDPRSEKMNLMVLVSTVKDAVEIAKAFPSQIELVNIGNAGKMNHSNQETTVLSKEVMLSKEEISSLKELINIYPKTFFQGTPVMEKKLASKILENL
ncbi:MAG: PTS sugar transporter subunit IIB [Lactobacillus sp.]|nr:PTS sugar transporter subunit IIB [Lactobacillus sp.]